MNIIEKKIKEIYNNDKSLFYKKMGWDYKNGARKIKKFISMIEESNTFLSNLDLKIEIVEISENQNKVETEKK